MHQDCRIITGRLSKTDKTFCIYPVIRVYILIDQYQYIEIQCFRGCLQDTGATFAPEQVHCGSLS